MRVIKVFGWSNVHQLQLPNENIILKKSVTERSVISAQFSNLRCSCDVNYLHSSYIQGKEKIFYGGAFSAVDRAIELALSYIKEKEEVILQINILGKYIHENIRNDVVEVQCKIVYSIVEMAKMVFELNNREKLDISKWYKDQASENYRLNLSDYSYAFPFQVSVFLLLVRSVKWLSMITTQDLTHADVEEYNELQIHCYNNISYFHLKIGNNEEAAIAASFVIHRSPKNIKALFRRAVANTNLQNYETACFDLQIILKNEPSNNRAKNQLDLVNEKMKSVDKVYANAMKKFLHFK